MPKKKQNLPYGLSGVKHEKVNVKDKGGRKYEYRCVIFCRNDSNNFEYLVTYETGFSLTGGLGKKYGSYKTKAQAQKAFTQMKKKLRASGHPFRG